MRAVRALACFFIVFLALSTIRDAAAAHSPQLSANSLSALGTSFSKKLSGALRQQQAQQAAKMQSKDAYPSPLSASQAKVATAAAGSSDAAASTAAADVFEVTDDSKGYYGDEYDQYYVTPKITLGDYLQKLFADLDKEYEAVEKEFKEGIEASREGLYQKLHGRKEKYNNYDSYDKSDGHYKRDEYHSYNEYDSTNKYDKYNNKYGSYGKHDSYDSYDSYDKSDKYPKYDSYDSYDWYEDKQQDGQYSYDSSAARKCPFSDGDLCHIYNSNGKDSYESYPGYGGKFEAACFKEVAHTGCQDHTMMQMQMTDEMKMMMKHRKQYISSLGCCLDAHHPSLDHFLSVGTAAYGYENQGYDRQEHQQEELTLFNPRGSHSECVWDIWYYHTPAVVDQWTKQVGTATATCYFGSEVAHCGNPITKGLTVTIAADVYTTEAVSKQGPKYPMGNMPRMGEGCESYDVGPPGEQAMPIQEPKQPSSTPSRQLTPPAAKRSPPSIPQQKVAPVTPPQQKLSPSTPPQQKQQTPAKAPATPVPQKQALPLLAPMKPTQQKQAPAKPAVPPQQKQALAKAPGTPAQQKQVPAAAVPKAQPAQPKAPAPAKVPVPTVPKKTNVPATLVPTPAPKTPAPSQTPKVAAPALEPATVQPAPVPASKAPEQKASTPAVKPVTPAPNAPTAAAKPATPAAKPATPAAKPQQPTKAAPAPTKAPATAKLATAAKLQWALPVEAEATQAEPADDLWAKLSNRLARFADYRGAKEAMVSIASVGTASTSSDVPFFTEPRMQYDDSPILYADKSFYDTVGNIRNTANIISNGHGWDTGMYQGTATIITGVITSVTGLGKDVEHHQGMVEHVIKFEGELLTPEMYKNLPFDVPHIKPGTYKFVFTGDKQGKEY